MSRPAAISPSKLLAMSIVPALVAIERAYLRLRLQGSVMAVDVLKRQLNNDIAAKVVARDMLNGAALLVTLGQQIDNCHADIKEQHQFQAAIHCRLAELG